MSFEKGRVQLDGFMRRFCSPFFKVQAEPYRREEGVRVQGVFGLRAVGVWVAYLGASV